MGSTSSPVHSILSALIGPALVWGVVLSKFTPSVVLLVYLGANVLILTQRLHRNTLLSVWYPEPEQRYQQWIMEHSGFFFIYLLFFPMVAVPLYFHYRRQLPMLRIHPRNCPACRAPMQLLDEKADDAFLTDGKLMEEIVESVDYDVWHCSSCEQVNIIPYEKLSTSYKPCPKCDHKTYHYVSYCILTSPTCYKSGEGEYLFRCEACDYQERKKYTIPQRDCSEPSRSSSSSWSSGSSWGSSSSSSSSSSSFGGGSSGGSGSGGSW